MCLSKISTIFIVILISATNVKADERFSNSMNDEIIESFLTGKRFIDPKISLDLKEKDSTEKTNQDFLAGRLTNSTNRSNSSDDELQMMLKR